MTFSRQATSGIVPPSATSKTILKIVSILPAGLMPDGRIVVTKKFLEGIEAYRSGWNGELAVYMPPGTLNTGNLDDLALRPEDFPCTIKVLPREEFAAAITSDRSALVLLGLDDFHQNQLSSVCEKHGIPCVYVSEYSLKTRMQIVDATASNPLKRLRRRIWEAGEERRRENAVRIATGLQCNGTPTYESYKSLCPDALLFFDTRTRNSMLASEEQVRQKLILSPPSRPLQLLFSGRLARIKGVMQLIDVSKELRQMKVDFHLSICGDGELKDELQQAIHREQLSQQVKLEGVLDFASQLVPLVKRSVDLFVCCHPQGDPSCTYLETMACGVPIAGYDNDAFQGVVRHSGAGWLTPMNRPEALAAEIHRVSRQPDELLTMSLKALSFARQHTFERTFVERIRHLQAMAEK